MHIEIAVAQFRPVKGKPAASLDRIEDSFARLLERESVPDVALYPETALTGYFLEGGVREHAVPAMSLATDLAERYARAGGDGRPLDVVLGFYEVWGHRLYNSAHVPRAGCERATDRARPPQGVPSDLRSLPGGTIRRGGPRGTRVRHPLGSGGDVDLRGPLSFDLGDARRVGRRAAPPGAQRLSRPRREAGQGVPANLGRWRRLAQGAAEEHGVGVAVSQLTGFEGGKGFAGGSLVFGPRGQLLAEGPLWDEAVIDTGLDLEELTAARTDQPLLADLERALPRLLQSRHLPPLEGDFDPTPTEAATASEDEGEWAGRPPRAGMSGAMDPALVAIDPNS